MSWAGFELAITAFVRHKTVRVPAGETMVLCNLFTRIKISVRNFPSHDQPFTNSLQMWRGNSLLAQPLNWLTPSYLVNMKRLEGIEQHLTLRSGRCISCSDRPRTSTERSLPPEDEHYGTHCHHIKSFRGAKSLLEKRSRQPNRELLRRCGTQRFIAVPTRVRYWVSIQNQINPFHTLRPAP
jgi:hypothetical protein